MKTWNLLLYPGLFLIVISQFIMKDLVLILGILLIMGYVLMVRKEKKDTALMPVFYVLLLFLILYTVAFIGGFRLFE
ncbi:MAG: hypothetical protein QMB63_01875 [Clostridiaceae bacterium]